MEEREHIWSTVKPIDNEEDDKLQRSEFASSIASSLKNWREKESLIVGIYGKWGDGKSSVKNLILKSLKESNDKKIKVINFAPWEWSEQKSLNNCFYKELSLSLRSDSDKKLKKIADLILNYQEYFYSSSIQLKKVNNGFKKTMVLCGIGSMLVGYSLPANIQKFAIIFSFTLLALSQFTESLSSFFEFVASFFRDKKDSISLEILKANISKKLLDADTSIIVFIDDIDRLSPQEIRSLFRLLKANADFPKMVYVTLFQKDIVENCLDEGAIYSGDEYLKKIIQVGFDLPKPPESKIHNVLNLELNKLITVHSSEYDSNRWGNVFIDGLDVYFKNLRDVNRFISILKFHLESAKNNMNFVDLVSLEILRQFDHKLYEYIYKNKKIFTSFQGNLFNHEEENGKIILEGFFALSKKATRDQLESFLDEVFPNTMHFYGKNNNQTFPNSFAQQRICNADVFDRYFLQYLPNGELSKNDYDYILSLSHNRKELYLYLMSFHDNGTLDDFFTKFESFVTRIDPKNCREFIPAIIDIADKLDSGRTGMFTISPFTHAERILYNFIIINNKVISPHDIVESLNDSHGIALAFKTLYKETIYRDRFKKDVGYIFSEDSRDELLAIAKAKGDSILRGDINLFEIESLDMTLFFWAELVNRDDVRNWVRMNTIETEQLILLLSKVISKSYSSSSISTEVIYYFSKETMETCFSKLENIFSRISEIEKFSKISNHVIIDALIDYRDNGPKR
ncbi:P-loop NTPase fold protein [Halobacteriovorax sp. RT-1-4]|uniref:KAP family P-loop NTPase fold protein n=1 Tax=unclassified Halobacteriovorax TaxID=2639665 RepID=UPI003999B16C